MPSIVPFPGGLKAYLDCPSAILALRPKHCLRCEGQRAWHVHRHRPRYTSCEGAWIRTTVFQLRCPDCHQVLTLLPDCLTPRLQHATDTIRTAIDAFVEVVGSYRIVAIDLAGKSLTEGRSVIWGAPEAPSPTPSTLFRWVARFSVTASLWTPLVMAELQRRMDSGIRPPACPPHLTLKARSAAKRAQLVDAWYLLWLLKSLLATLGQTTTAWPQTLAAAARLPSFLPSPSWLSRAPP